MTRKWNRIQVCLGEEAVPNLPTNRCKVPMGSTWPGPAPDLLQPRVLMPSQDNASAVPFKAAVPFPH